MANIGIDILSLPQAISVVGTEQVPLVQGGTTKRANASQVGQAFFTNQFPANFEYLMFGNGGTLGTGVFGVGITVPFKSVITQVTLLVNTSGNFSVDIWRTTEALFDAGITHPGPGDSIVGGNFPTITAATKFQDSTLSGWTTLLNAGDILWYNVRTATGVANAGVYLQVNRQLP